MMRKKALTGVIIAIVVVIISAILISQNDKAQLSIKVPDYYSLDKFYFTGNFDEFYKDSYEWYKSIESEEGVYLINTAYYDDEILKVWKENKIYNYIPDKPFWYFAASPSYLDEMGISISNDDINSAENGTRLYLIPDTLSDNEVQLIENYLKEDALINADKSNIQTTFTKSLEIKFASYSPAHNYFTFPSDKEEELTAEAPIIYVCTSENMKNFENESLIATGVDSYIKFADKEVCDRLTNNSTMNKYELKFEKLSAIYKKASRAKIVDSNVKHINFLNRNKKK